MDPCFISIDIAKDAFVASTYHRPKEPALTKENFGNDRYGYDDLIIWLNEHHIMKASCQVCLETTWTPPQPLDTFLKE